MTVDKTTDPSHHKLNRLYRLLVITSNCMYHMKLLFFKNKFDVSFMYLKNILRVWGLAPWKMLNAGDPKEALLFFNIS